MEWNHESTRIYRNRHEEEISAYSAYHRMNYELADGDGHKKAQKAQ